MRQIFISFGDIFNMGKIQELRNKVNSGEIGMNNIDLTKCLAAEFLATFILMFVGCGCGVSVEGRPTTALVNAALCWGFIVASLIVMFGHVSGCHMNPAMTLAMLVTSRIKPVKAGLYIVVQCLASTAGVAVLKALSPSELPEGVDESAAYIGYIKLAKGITPLQGFGLEFLITFVLVFTVFAISDEHRDDIKGSPALAIGFVLAAIIFFAGPLTGACLNPARALGPCIVNWIFDDHWLYWLGPIGGAIVAAVVYQHIFRALRPDEVQAAELERERKRREQMDAKDAENNLTPPPV